METSIQFYSHDRHYGKLCDWMTENRIGIPDPKMLSDVGLVVNDTAIGFLFKTNSKTCFIDNIVTNPDKKPGERHEALNCLIENLGAMARKSGFVITSILSNTENMDKRLLELGYKNHDTFKLFYKGE